jgi:hypothetical protein
MEKVKLKIVHKAYKFRLKPSDDQKKQFAQIAGVCRLVWNLCLEPGLGTHLTQGA